MSDNEPQNPDHLPAKAPLESTTEDDRQSELFPADLLRRVLEVEQQRIESTNRRTDVALQAVKASDESDRRQFEFQIEKLRSDERAETRRHDLAKIVVLGFGALGSIVIILFLGMAFFGSEAQSSIALAILRTLAIGGGGYGVIAGLINMVRRLLRKPDDPV